MWRKRLQRAYGRPTHKEALEALEQLHRELEERNQSAASSLEEGLEGGVYGVLGHSLKTTNCIESVNALSRTLREGRSLDFEPTPGSWATDTFQSCVKRSSVN